MLDHSLQLGKLQLELNVVAGSVFSFLQSAGVVGLTAGTTAAVGAAGGAVGAAAATTVVKLVDKSGAKGEGATGGTVGDATATGTEQLVKKNEKKDEGMHISIYSDKEKEENEL